MATEFAAALLKWFDGHGRHDLPWQNPRTPYRVWVSEIMLQQTQVSVVIDYFQRFMQRFADIPALAAAAEDDVMAHWAGLGYYARARNLHAAAKQVAQEHDGKLPADLDALMALPGIGRSTAGAICALAFDQPTPILDGNAKRVYARYHAVAGYPGTAKVAHRLWDIATRHTPAKRPADYTQAIMDLGATLCVRNNPQCARCPLHNDCAAYAENATHSYPAPKPRRKRPLRHVRMLVIREQDSVLLVKRPPAGVWGGLWSLPEVPENEHVGDFCRTCLGFGIDTAQQLPPVRHGLTHFELEIQPLAVRATALDNRIMQPIGHDWYKMADLPALPAPVKRLLQQLDEPSNTVKQT